MRQPMFHRIPWLTLSRAQAAMTSTFEIHLLYYAWFMAFPEHHIRQPGLAPSMPDCMQITQKRPLSGGCYTDIVGFELMVSPLLLQTRSCSGWAFWTWLSRHSNGVADSLSSEWSTSLAVAIHIAGDTLRHPYVLCSNRLEISWQFQWIPLVVLVW